MTLVQLSDATFDETVGASELPLLVEFGAEWCGPCHMLEPVLEELAGELAGRVAFATVDIDDALDVSRRFEVMSAPTMVLFVDGDVVWRTVGARGKRQLREELDRVLPTEKARM